MFKVIYAILLVLVGFVLGFGVKVEIVRMEEYRYERSTES